MKNLPSLSEQSNRIELLRFPLIVLIVLLHSNRSEVVLSGGVDTVQTVGTSVIFIKNAVSESIARAAVPLFFYISGFLYFAPKAFSKEIYINKTKRRVFTILVPILFWNAAILIALAIAQAVPLTASYFSGNRTGVLDYTAGDFLTAFTGVGGSMTNDPFWFLRDLFVLCLLAPVVYFILRSRFSIIAILLLGASWLLNLGLIRIPSIEATFYFVVGAFSALRVGSPFFMDRYRSLFFALALILVPLDAYFQLSATNILIHKLSILICAGAFLTSTKCVLEIRVLRERLYSLANQSFFVYAAHGFLLGVFIKISYKIFAPVDGVKMLFLYFLNPLCTVVSCLIIYQVMFSVCPKFLSLITGGRKS